MKLRASLRCRFHQSQDDSRRRGCRRGWLRFGGGSPLFEEVGEFGLGKLADLGGKGFSGRAGEQIACGVQDEDDGHAVIELGAIPAAQEGDVLAAGRDVKWDEMLVQGGGGFGGGFNEPVESLAGRAVC